MHLKQNPPGNSHLTHDGSMLVFEGCSCFCVLLFYMFGWAPFWRILAKILRLLSFCSHLKSSWCSAKDGFARPWISMQLQTASHRPPKNRCTKKMVQDICIQVTFVWCSRCSSLFWILILICGCLDWPVRESSRMCKKMGWDVDSIEESNARVLGFKECLGRPGPMDHDLVIAHGRVNGKLSGMVNGKFVQIPTG